MRAFRRTGFADHDRRGSSVLFRSERNPRPMGAETAADLPRVLRAAAVIAPLDPWRRNRQSGKIRAINPLVRLVAAGAEPALGTDGSHVIARWPGIVVPVVAEIGRA